MTKFNVGDEVWYMAGTRVMMGIIVGIQYSDTTYYRVQDGVYPEESLYSTLDELLKNISRYR